MVLTFLFFYSLQIVPLHVSVVFLYTPRRLVDCVLRM